MGSGLPSTHWLLMVFGGAETAAPLMPSAVSTRQRHPRRVNLCRPATIHLLCLPHRRFPTIPAMLFEGSGFVVIQPYEELIAPAPGS